MEGVCLGAVSAGVTGGIVKKCTDRGIAEAAPGVFHRMADARQQAPERLPTPWMSYPRDEHQPLAGKADARRRQ